MAVHASSGSRSVFVPIWVALAAGSVVMLAGQSIRYALTTSSGGVGGGVALLLPWVLLVVAAALIAVTDGPVRLALVGASGTVAMSLAAPFVVDRLQGVGLPEVVWRSASDPVYAEWESAIAEGQSVPIAVARWVMVAGMLLLFAFAVVAAARLRPLLLGPASRSGFGIDMTVLLAVFAIAAIAIGRAGVSGGWLDGLTDAWSTDIPDVVTIRTFSWVLPLVIWLALACRQGGALAVGATAGLVVTFIVLPWAVDVIGDTIGDKMPGYAGTQAGGGPSPYEALDWTGTKPMLGVLSVVLLLIALWWALGVQSSGSRPPLGVASGSKVNALSVVSFTLSWFPITAIPAIVLGHVAYDQVADAREPQRGIGLARWSIILGYLTLLGGASVAYNTWG